MLGQKEYFVTHENDIKFTFQCPHLVIFLEQSHVHSFTDGPQLGAPAAEMSRCDSLGWES